MNKLKIWLKRQWGYSFAKMIWDDLTPFGRATIWIPIWIITIPFLILVAGLAILISWFLDKCYKLNKCYKLKIPPIFFK